MAINTNDREAAVSVIETLRTAGHSAMLAGGCVRDTLLGLQPKDYDVATDAVPERVAGLFRQTEMVGAKFGVAIVRLGVHQIEVATFRSDGEYSDGRHPDSVTFGNAADDANRRDFTINGMFFDVATDSVIDHVGGLRDLEARIVRAIGDPTRRFEEDHLRMLRAVRFAARLGFDIEAGTLSAIRLHAKRLRDISTERVMGECRSILTHPSRARGWRLVDDAGLADHIILGMVFSSDRTTIDSRLSALVPDATFATAMSVLLHQMPAPVAEAVCRRFACSNAEAADVAWLMSRLERVQAPDLLELADIKRLRADRRFGQLCDRLRAELSATSSPLTAWDALRSRAAAIPADRIVPPPFVTGGDLLDRDIPQGPVYARILGAIYSAQLNDAILDRHAALQKLDAMICEE